MTMALKETKSAKEKILKWLKLVGSRETGTGITNIDMSLKEGQRSKVKNLKMAETCWEWVIGYGDHDYRHGVKGGGTKIIIFSIMGVN